MESESRAALDHFLLKAFRDPILNGVEYVVQALSFRYGESVLTVPLGESPGLGSLLSRAREGDSIAIAWLSLRVVGGAVAVSGLAIWISHCWIGTSLVGFYTAAAAWAAVFGFWTLCFLPQKYIAGILGFLFGTSASDISSVGGLISKTQGSVAEIAKQIGIILKTTGNPNPILILRCVWIFFLIYLIFCLLGFVAREKETDRSGRDTAVRV